MSSEPSTDKQDAVQETKQQIRSLVDEIAELAKRDFEPDQYYAEFLRRVVEALAAVGGAVWRLNDDGQLQLAYQIDLKKTSLDQEGEHQMRHARLLGQVIQAGEGILVPPHAGAGGDTDGANPTEMLLVLAPVRAEDHTDSIIEIFQRPTAQPATRRGYLRFLQQMCDLAGEWLKSRKLREFGARESMWCQVDNFSRQVHETLDVRACAYTIANEAQGLVGCDRVSVAIKRGNRCRIEAVSGQDTFDARSNLINLLGQLATKVVSVGEPVWYAGSTQDLLPQIEDSIQQYVDESHSKTVAVVPLECSRDPATSSDKAESDRPEEDRQIGALIFEQIEDIRPQKALAPRIELVRQHSARALTNAVRYNDLFLMPVWRALGKTQLLVRAKTLPKTVAVIAGLILAVAILCLYPARFDLKGQGVLQPVVQRDVFVSGEGIVQEVLVRHGQWVEKGQVLARLSNTDLDVRLADVLGQKRSTQQQLSSIGRLRHDPKLPNDEKARLAGQFLQLSQRLASLQSQHMLLEEKQKRLIVHSPIRGEIITWDLHRQLLHRPVSPGEVLLTVADPRGEWEMEVFMPENRMGHIAHGQQELGPDLSVQYIVATDPTQQWEGKIKEIHALAQLHEEHGHSISVLVDVNKEDLHDPRPGASVTAEVHCGHRPLGYVWLHDVFEFVQSRILFNL